MRFQYLWAASSDEGFGRLVGHQVLENNGFWFPRGQRPVHAQSHTIQYGFTTIQYTRTQQYISGTVLYTRAEVHAHTQYNIQRLTTLYNARTKVHKERDDKMWDMPLKKHLLLGRFWLYSGIYLFRPKTIIFTESSELLNWWKSFFTIFLKNIAGPWNWLHDSHLLQTWPPNGATWISSKSYHHLAQLEMVANLATRWRHLPFASRNC